eukprot:1152273-Pelagomonas_calceolata.AAC.1
MCLAFKNLAQGVYCQPIRAGSKERNVEKAWRKRQLYVHFDRLEWECAFCAGGSSAEDGRTATHVKQYEPHGGPTTAPPPQKAPQSNRAKQQHREMHWKSTGADHRRQHLVDARCMHTSMLKATGH